MTPSILRKARTFLALPGTVRALLLPAWVLLGIARGAILLVSFRRIAPLLGVPVGPDHQGPALDAGQEERALLVGQAVRLAARYTAWTSNCLPQAVAARALLGLHGIPCTVHFGLARRPGGPIEAHAWVHAGNVAVTGGGANARYAIVGVFATPAGPRQPPLTPGRRRRGARG